MNAEVSDELERRVTMHAALADPARLTIVDLLLVGDASPTELQARLSMPSNLMAHHVGVLDRAGLIRRQRSGGDRRRTYLSLVTTALDQLVPTADRTAERLVFVCTQNSARSQLAAAVWRRHSPVPATSAGTSPAAEIHPGAVAVARRYGLALRPTVPRRVDDVLRPEDLVVAVCDNAHEELSPALPRMHWSVADPTRKGTDAAFERTLEDLTERVRRVAPAIRRARASSGEGAHRVGCG